MTVDLLYVGFNRIDFTKASFEALLNHTNWEHVRTLHVHDDGSSDGTAAYLDHASRQAPVGDVKFESMRLRGPVAAMNRHLDLCPPDEDVGAFVKIDNDFVVSPGWLDELLRVSTLNPGYDAIGLQPRFGPPVPGFSDDRRVEEARHIGGIGFMRHRMFEVCRPVANGRYGWSEHQTRHPESRKGWLYPDLPCFSLDLIDVEPWASLSAGYIEKGWQREWAKYADGGRGYFEWWRGAP